MKLVTGLLAAVLVLVGFGAGHAAVHIVDDRGGQIGIYVNKYQRLRSPDNPSLLTASVHPPAPLFSARSLTTRSA